MTIFVHLFMSIVIRSQKLPYRQKIPYDTEHRIPCSFTAEPSEVQDFRKIANVFEDPQNQVRKPKIKHVRSELGTSCTWKHSDFDGSCPKISPGTEKEAAAAVLLQKSTLHLIPKFVYSASHYPWSWCSGQLKSVQL
jgi:hypothetical protein